MTPDRRLDQLEPLVADVLQKVDRLIEGQGHLLEVAVRADQHAETAARGVANLTVDFTKLRQEVSEEFKIIDQKIDTEVGDLRQEMKQGFDSVNQRFDQLITFIQERLR